MESTAAGQQLSLCCPLSPPLSVPEVSGAFTAGSGSTEAVSCLAAILATPVVVPIDAQILPGSLLSWSPPVTMHLEDTLFFQSDSRFYFQLDHINYHIYTELQRTQGCCCRSLRVVETGLSAAAARLRAGQGTLQGRAQFLELIQICLAQACGFLCCSSHFSGL